MILIVGYGSSSTSTTTTTTYPIFIPIKDNDALWCPASISSEITCSVKIGIYALGKAHKCALSLTHTTHTHPHPETRATTAGCFASQSICLVISWLQYVLRKLSFKQARRTNKQRMESSQSTAEGQQLKPSSVNVLTTIGSKEIKKYTRRWLLFSSCFDRTVKNDL